MQTLQEERRKLALEAQQGDEEAVTRLEEIEAELRAADVAAERERLAEEEAKRRAEQDRQKSEEAARQQARAELRQAATARETAAEKIEDAVADLVEAIDNFATAGGEMQGLLEPAGIPQRSGAQGGPLTFGTEGLALWVITRLYGSNPLPKPLPARPGGTGGSFAAAVRASHKEDLRLNDEEEKREER